MPAPDDLKDVRSAVRLGWYMAEVRGWNRPGGPPGAAARLPDDHDRALPLYIERNKSQRRIEAQAVVAGLAEALAVDTRPAGAPPEGTSFSADLDEQANLLYYLRAAGDTLQRSHELLKKEGEAVTSRSPDDELMGAIKKLETAIETLTAPKATATSTKQAGANVKQIPAPATRVAATPEHPPGPAQPLTDEDGPAVAAETSEQARAGNRQAAVGLLRRALDELRQATMNPAAADLNELASIQAAVKNDAATAWANLAELLWKFDAHIQDQLRATSDTKASGYQLGRGLSETYWALDPGQAKGSTGWEFLLGDERCAELSRLAGQLAAYLNEYTAPAVAASIEVWKAVAHDPSWRGDPGQEPQRTAARAAADLASAALAAAAKVAAPNTAAPNTAAAKTGEPAEQREAAQKCLYRQVGRWYELIVLGGDPTILIEPFNFIKNYKALRWALRFFWPQVALTMLGFSFLITLLVLVGVGSGTTFLKTLSGILALLGISFGGITGALKNSAQAMLKRLRGDTYTELVAIAVQTAPPNPSRLDTQQAIRKLIQQRDLTTPATPN